MESVMGFAASDVELSVSPKVACSIRCWDIIAAGVLFERKTGRSPGV
jgi:hypothetical protein